MSEPFGRLRRFLRELKRRKVYRVAATYAVVGFVLIQVADLTFVRLGLPSWTVTFVIALVAVGFPLSLIMAWAFEVTPEGVRRTPDAQPEEEEPAEAEPALSTGYKVLVGLGVVAAAVAGGWYLTGGGGENPEIDDRSVAVLPFEALGQEKPGTFTEGMHSDLQTKLSNVAGLTVTSSRSVEQYRGSEESTAAVAQELGVGWIVTGDVQRMGDQIQVNVRLVDPATDAQAWTESYRRDLTAENLFAIQTDITREVARSLQAELSPEETERVERRPTGDLDAYRLYVQGRSQINTRTEKGLRRAAGYFERAIAQDSSYALAWAGLADALGLLEASGYPVPTTASGAEDAARRALKLNPDLAEAHASVGFVHMQGRNAPAALKALEKAVGLKPSYAQAHHWLGWLLPHLGRLEHAEKHASLAVELNPRHAAAGLALAVVYISLGSVEEGLVQVRRVGRMYPAYPDVAVYEALALVHRGQLEQATKAAREALSPAGVHTTWARTMLAVSAAASGDSAEAERWISRMEKTKAPPAFRGIGLAVLGKTEAAFSAFQRVETWPIWASIAVRHWFPDLLRSLRADSRYEALIRDINESWGLNADGSLPDSVDVSFAADSYE